MEQRPKLERRIIETIQKMRDRTVKKNTMADDPSLSMVKVMTSVFWEIKWKL